MNINNIYELLTNTNYYEHLIRTKQFILSPHQTIPKYYLLSNDIHKLILNYSMGSGKSAAAVFTALYNLNLFKMYSFCLNYTNNDNRFFKENSVKQNIIVVGSWQTEAQVDIELIRPEFNVVSHEKINEINELNNSIIQDNINKGEEEKRNLVKQFNKYILFLGYQALFNLLFPNIQIEKYSQNIDALIYEYNQGNIKISKDFIINYTNSLIIIDEMQRLYSYEGLNTYGFAVVMLSKVARKYNIKMLFLTGTIINSSVSEVVDIINIMSDNEKIYTRTELCEQVNILENINIFRLKKDKYEFCIDILKNNYFYHNNAHKKFKYELLNVKDLSKNIYIPDYVLQNKNMKCLYKKGDKIYPDELYIGNNLISNKNDMIIYTIDTYGLQDKKYINYISKNKEDNIFNEENESSISIYDAYIPPKNEWMKYNIYDYLQGVLMGEFLSLKNLKNFSTIGYEMFNLCYYNAIHNEKTVIYHNKLNSFGIKQYSIILQYNGFIHYGEQPSKNSICKSCTHTYEEHLLPLEKKINNKICNDFKGIYFNLLIGTISQNERDVLVNDVYNNPNNLYGDLLSVLFVSDVAYSGVSLLNTNNILILSRIPNISKWKQICARIVRTRSHSLLPKEKQYAKIYTFTIKSPEEKGKYFFTEQYYTLRKLLNEDVEDFIDKLASQCISNILFYNPSKYTLSNMEKKITNILLYNDLSYEINNIIDRLLIDNYTYVWKLDTLIKLIKDKHVLTSYIDTSFIDNNTITYLLYKNNKITIFIDNDVKYAFININTNDVNYCYSSIKFDQFNILNNEFKNVNNLMINLQKEKSFHGRINILNKIFKNLRNNFSILVGYDIFWQTMYNLGNEYYDDDETNFFENHTSKNRDINKMNGCYYNEKIILKNGCFKNIKYTFPDVEPVDKLPYIFKITCLNFNNNDLFYLHVNVIKLNAKNTTDKRYVYKGINCTSMNVEELETFYPNKNNLHKKQYCKELMHVVCEEQTKTKNKFVYSPFEK